MTVTGFSLRCGRFRLDGAAARGLVRVERGFGRLRWYLAVPGLFAAAVSAVGGATALGPAASAWWIAIPLLLGAWAAASLRLRPPRHLTWAELAREEDS